MTTPRTLLLTRPIRQSQAFADELNTALPGMFTPVIIPLIEIVPVPGSIDLSDTQALLLTSANGVEQIAARTENRDIPALCVGEMTAAAAREAGFPTQCADGNVESLAALAHSNYKPGSGALLHIRGRHAAGNLTGLLRELGIAVRAAEIYNQQTCPPTLDADRMFTRGRIDVVALFSPRTAQFFAETACTRGWNLTATRSVALSAAVDAALGSLPLAERCIAVSPGRTGMIDALSTL